QALETGQGYNGTVEFFPEEGKYHLDGHRTCGVRLAPAETKQHHGLCPACGKELTVGVMHRVEELADRPDGSMHQNPKPFRSFVPLPEVLGEINGVGATARKVENAYEKLLGQLGSELFILELAPLDEVRRAGSTLLAEGIARMRQSRVIRQAGYDGEYGVIRLFTDDELAQGKAVSLLFDLRGRAEPAPRLDSVTRLAGATQAQPTRVVSPAAKADEPAGERAALSEQLEMREACPALPLS